MEFFNDLVTGCSKIYNCPDLGFEWMTYVPKAVNGYFIKKIDDSTYFVQKLAWQIVKFLANLILSPIDALALFLKGTFGTLNLWYENQVEDYTRNNKQFQNQAENYIRQNAPNQLEHIRIDCDEELDYDVLVQTRRANKDMQSPLDCHLVNIKIICDLYTARHQKVRAIEPSKVTLKKEHYPHHLKSDTTFIQIDIMSKERKSNVAITPAEILQKFYVPFSRD